MPGLLDFLQSASNAVAANVSGPVDLTNLLFGKVGVEIDEPVGGSKWMERKGLTRKVPQSAVSVAGETAGLLAPVLMASKAAEIAAGLLARQEALKPESIRQYISQTGAPGVPATVWHGSPHKFDKFDSSRIGTGEGAQAYGHGLYLADSPDVAKSYTPSFVEMKVLRNPEAIGNGQADWAFKQTGGDSKRALELLGKKREVMSRNKDMQYLIPEIDDAIKQISTGSVVSVDSGGAIYKVDLPDSAIAKMLDWDKPLSQQAPEVRSSVAQAFPGTYVNGRFVDPANSQLTGRALLDQLADIADKRGVPGMRAAEPALRKAGIPGIRYLDGGSRGAGTGTSNYVVFPGEEDILTILERNGVTINGKANVGLIR